jgi:hypothetical protein
MEPESVQRIDLAPLDPGGWQAKSAALAARALERRRLRRTVVVRGSVALAVSFAAALVLWLSAPRPAPRAPASASSLLDWATHDTDPTEVLRYAQ